MANLLAQLDAQLTTVLSDWGLSTTVLALTIIAFVAYPIIYQEEPDTHPLLLARQSSVSAVRNKNESAVYRSPEVPQDSPLRSGLGVKDVGQPRWASGRDGDVRDVWREVQKGGRKEADGKEVPCGVIMTVLGKEELVEHDVSEVSREIQIMGTHMKGTGCKRVAIYLPNSMEYLSTLFGMYPAPPNTHSINNVVVQPAPSTASPPSSSPTASPTPKSTNSSTPRKPTASSARRATCHSTTSR